MAFDSFIPQIWSARLLSTLDKTLVYAGLCNRDYEGEIKDKGSSVKINTIGPITVNDYEKDTDMSALENLSTTDTTLTIDQSKSFGFYLDDVNKAQAAGDVMDKAMKQAAYALADVADKFIASLYTEVDSGNLIGNDGGPITPTKNTIYDHLVDMNTRLTKCSVPKEGRWVVVAPWVTGKNPYLHSGADEHIISLSFQIIEWRVYNELEHIPTHYAMGRGGWAHSVTEFPQTPL